MKQRHLLLVGVSVIGRDNGSTGARGLAPVELSKSDRVRRSSPLRNKVL
jgi:hypothetical protein